MAPEGSTVCTVDSDNIVLGVKAACKEGFYFDFEVEGASLMLALQWAHSENWESCIFEIDNVEAYNTLYKGCNTILIRKSWIKDCDTILSEHVNWRISLICREANFKADTLERKASMETWCWNLPFAIPRSVFKS